MKQLEASTDSVPVGLDFFMVPSEMGEPFNLDLGQLTEILLGLLPSFQ